MRQLDLQVQANQQQQAKRKSKLPVRTVQMPKRMVGMAGFLVPAEHDANRNQAASQDFGLDLSLRCCCC
jgi:hypothetical protein